MFKFINIYTDLIHVSKVQGNPAKSKITYYFDGKIETQTFADSTEYDEVMDDLEQKFVTIGGVLYNPDRISVVSVKNLSVSFYFLGGKIIAENYADQSEVDDVVQKIDVTHVEVAPNKWISSKQLHVADADETTLKIKYEYLGGEIFDVIYEDQAAYDTAVEKLESLGEGGGGGAKKVKTPKIMPAGGEVETGTEVTITCATEGAIIHYTTDGTTPTASSPTYTAAFTINRTTTVKAIAMKTDMKDSSVATTNYIINVPTVATPTFSPSAGAVDKGTEVTIACTTAGAVIHYTTDGSTPDATSPVYDGTPIEITAAITLKAIGVADEMLDSDVATAAYTIKLYRYLGDYNMVGNAAGDDYDPAYQLTLETLDTLITGIDWFEANVYNEAADAKLNANTKSAGTPSSEWTIGSNAQAEFGYQVVYAYPASLGELTAITNNSFDATGSYTHVTRTYDGVDYLVYFLTDPAGTVSENMKWSFN